MFFFIFAVAALDADHSEDMSDAPEAKEDTIDDDEAAEILEAMLGLAPALQASEPSKKRRRSTTKVRWCFGKDLDGFWSHIVSKTSM